MSMNHNTHMDMLLHKYKMSHGTYTDDDLLEEKNIESQKVFHICEHPYTLSMHLCACVMCCVCVHARENVRVCVYVCVGEYVCVCFSCVRFSV